MTVSAWVSDIVEADFQQEVIERSRTVPIVVDFWADWCGPCKEIGPLLETIAEEYDGAFILVKINTDQAPNLMNALQIQSIPLVIAFRDGQPAQHFQGNLPEAEVRDFFKQVLPGVVPGKPAELEPEPDPLENLDANETEAHHRAKLAEDAQDNAALIGLADIVLARSELEEAAELLSRVDPGGETEGELERLQALLSIQQTAAPFNPVSEARARLEADPNKAQRRYELGCTLLATSEYETGLATLLGAAQLDRKLAAEEVKQVMVQAFYAIGSRSELADSYRQKLTMLLY